MCIINANSQFRIDDTAFSLRVVADFIAVCKGQGISFKNLNTTLFNITTKIRYFTDIQRGFKDNRKFDSLTSANALSFVDQSVHVFLRTNAHYLLDSEKNFTK